ncbi:MAG: hypothetical protein RRC34_03370 [Lentisphaeria bacterium]|nr:hypothetical protein [Lentisphaeria bacterium]
MVLSLPGSRRHFEKERKKGRTRENLALSPLSEFIENGGEEYDKQDCELKGFYRMALELKRQFPRLPVCLLLDSLYANETLLNICLAKAIGEYLRHGCVGWKVLGRDFARGIQLRFVFDTS